MRDIKEISDLADEIEFVQTQWRFRVDEGTSLADYTAAYLHTIGYRKEGR